MSPRHPESADSRLLWAEVSLLLETGHRCTAITRLKSAASTTDSAWVRLTLGGLLAEQDDAGGAIREWMAALDMATLTGDRPVLAAVTSNLAAIYRELGDPDLAQRFQQRSLALQDDFGAEDLLHLANDAICGERWELAASLLEAARGLADEQSPIQSELAATQGVLCGLLGEPVEGWEWLRKALEEHLTNSDQRSAGKDLLNLAGLAQQRGRLRVAQRCLREAVACFHAGGCRALEAQAHERLSQTDRLIAIRRQRAHAN